ncbi:hypothetical protein FRC03_003588 [Tulasnella sp. 419]|nr:hypothetical protein FRC03_003588 [Tulasnella sp. 419]
MWAIPTGIALIWISMNILGNASLLQEDEIEEDVREVEALGWLINRAEDLQTLHEALMCLPALASSPLRHHSLLNDTHNILAILINTLVDPNDQQCLLGKSRWSRGVDQGYADEMDREGRLMFYLACLAEVSAVTMDGRNRQGQRGIQWDNLMAKIYGSWWYQNWYRILTIPPQAAMAREFHFPRIWYPWLKFTQPDAFLLDLQVLSTHPHAYIRTMARATLSQLYPYESPLANHSSWPVLHNKLPVNPDFFTFHKILVELCMVTMWVIDECRWKKRLEISRRRYLYRYCDNVLKLWMSSLASQEGGADDAQDGRIYQSALLLGYLILENHHNILRVTDSGESTPMKAARCLMSLKRWLDHSQGEDQKISAMDLELRNSLALSIVSSTAAYLQFAADTIKPGSRLTRLERFEDDENTIYVGMKHLEIPLLNLAAQEWQIPSLQDQAISALEAFYQIPGHANFRLFPWELPESSGLSHLMAKLKSRATSSSNANKRVSDVCTSSC